MLESRQNIINGGQLDEEKPFRRASSASFIVLLIVLGIPLWWHTTKVHRAPLPHLEMTRSVPIQVPVLVRLGSINGTFDDQFMSTLVAQLNFDLLNVHVHDMLRLDFAVVRQSFDNWPRTFGSDQALTQDFLLIPDVDWSDQLSRVHFTRDRLTLIHVESLNIRDLSSLIMTVIVDVTLDVAHLKTMVRRDLKQRMTGWELATMTERQQKRHVWDSAALSAKYRIDLVLVHPEPNMCRDDDHLGEELTTLLRPFSDKLSLVTNLTVNSEHLYYVDLLVGHHLDPILDKNVLEIGSLSLLTDSFERHLSGTADSWPLFRLVIHFTPIALLIVDENTNPVPGNAFVVASWGGLAVVNECAVDRRQLAAILMEQLRLLMGVDVDLPARMSKVASPLADWEERRLAVRALVDNLLRATTTLQALDKLLDEIRNIVIESRVAERVFSSIDASRSSIQMLNQGQFDSAVEWAQKASKEANSAFFDPALLALLYFPDDQKYAIYIPLFLPVGVPLLISLRFLFTQYYYYRRH